MKQTRMRLIMTIIVLLLIHHAPHANAQEEVTQEAAWTEVNIHLKVNQYYMLFMKGGQPFISAEQRLYAPLDSLEALWGISSSYDTQSGIWSFFLENDEARLNSSQLLVSKSGINMVPLRPLIDAMGLSSSWHHQEKLLEIEDTRLMKTPYIQAFEQGDVPHAGGWVDNPHAFTLTNVQIQNVLGSPFKLEITAVNRTGHSIAEGQEDIHPVFYYPDGTWSTESNVRVERLPSAQIKADASITKNFSSDLGVKYIVLIARTLSTP